MLSKLMDFRLGWTLLLSVAFYGCGEGDHGHSHEDGDGHAHASDDKTDEEESDHGHDGEKHDLGSADGEGWKLLITQTGDVAPGKEALFDIAKEGDSASGIETVRLWVGREDGKGSMKTKASEEGAGYHAHVQVPRTYDDESKLWLEVEMKEGDPQIFNVDVHRHSH